MIEGALLETVKIVLSAVIPTAVAISAAAIALPLTRFWLIISGLVSAALLFVILAGLVQPTWVMAVPVLLAFLAILQWRALARRCDILFLIAADNLWEDVTIAQYRAFGRQLALCPIGFLTPLKMKVIATLAGGAKARIVSLEAEKVGDQYRCFSPTEMALARMDDPRTIERQKTINVYFLRKSFNVNIIPPENEFRASIEIRACSIPILTDILSSGPGAFGFVTARAPSLSDWKPICAMEAMLISSAAMDFVALTAEMKRVADTHSRIEYFLAYLTFRLRLFENRYGPLIDSTGGASIFETAHIANLRSVALEFNRRHIRDDFHQSIWFTNFLYALMAYFSGATVYARSNHAGPASREMSWLVALMARFVDVQKNGKFYVPLAAEEEPAEVDSEAIVEAVNSGDWGRAIEAFLSLADEGREPVSAITEEGEAQRISGLGRGERRSVGTAWTAAVPSLQDHRCMLLLGALGDRQMELMQGIFQDFAALFLASPGQGGVAETPDPNTIFGRLRKTFVQSEWLAEDQVFFATRLRDPMAATVVSGKYRTELGWIKRWRVYFADLAEIAGQDLDDARQEKRVLAKLEEALPAPWLPWFRAARAMPDICQSSLVFCRDTVRPGAAYGEDEAFYCMALAILMFDRLSPDDAFTKALDKAERIAVGLIRDDNIVDRASLLWLSAELLARWRPKIGEQIEKELRSTGLPAPTWLGKLMS
ncbi:MAG TPA: hypothetical protein VGB04_04570 [Allosphingosinicella sp.]|jgi:hypothetical protein